MELHNNSDLLPSLKMYSNFDCLVNTRIGVSRVEIAFIELNLCRISSFNLTQSII